MRKSFFFLFLLSLFVLSSESQAQDGLSYCQFGPKSVLLEPVVKGKKGDSCTGTVKVQKMMWACIPQTKVRKTTKRFLKEMKKAAKEDCEKHCRSRGENCTGKLTRVKRCGLSNSPTNAAAAGRSLGCGKGCKGRAHAFCSLYNAAFHLENEELTEKQKPNCKCIIDTSEND